MPPRVHALLRYAHHTFLSSTGDVNIHSIPQRKEDPEGKLNTAYAYTIDVIRLRTPSTHPISDLM